MEARRSLEFSVQEVVYAGLDALQALGPFDLCAYLHDSAATGPQLFLVAPRLGATRSTRAFAIFSDLSDALDHSYALGPADGSLPQSVVVAGIPGLAVPTFGPESRGVHAIGRKGGVGDGAVAQAATHLATTLGAAVHKLQFASEPTASAW